MIRILFVIPTLVRGGAEKQLTLLATGLPRDQFDVHVAVLTHTGPYEQRLRAAGVPVHVIGKRWKLDPFSYGRLVKHIRALGPDIVHTWLFAANAYGRQAAIQARVPHIIGGERCVDPWKRSYELAIDRYLASRTERIVTNSTGVREFYASRGVAAEKFVVIPNGVELPAEASPAPRQELLRELNLPAGARLIGAIGRLWPQKRVKDLIWATDHLRSAHDNVHLLIVGDGPLRSRLERYRDLTGLAGRVHFLGERGDVPALLPHLDVLWLASEYEGQSNAILEGMAAGVPVVATDIPGNRDLVVHEGTGFLVPVGDRYEFIRCTHWLLEDEQLRRSLGAAGRARMAEHFTVAKMVAQHAALYGQLGK